MARFHDVKLELVRPGPPHNQLLSPLTSYMALCGDGSPITFRIDLEHRKLLSRLEQLRYLTAARGGGVVAMPDRVREAAADEVGEDVANILSQVRTLLGEVSRARGEGSAFPEEPQFVHLRLVLGGSELALIPFEMALSPPAFPGEGLDFGLQIQMPVVLSRETRRSRPVPVRWDEPRETRILVLAAAPAGLRVPLDAHLENLRAAIDPWVRWTRDGEVDSQPAKQQPLERVKERLRVLPDASIEEIYELCSQEDFTHIHILAHGDCFEVAGERRFGIALCERGNPMKKQVVDGERLAKALQAEGRDGSKRSRPLVVTLLVCDSGNPGSVLVPGGSIAHNLHAAGIPWVFASQFPLTVAGSVRMTAALYPRLLRGDDPRQALFEVRRLLFMSTDRDHDWASIVAYTSTPYDFHEQVAGYLEQQTKAAIEVDLERADNSHAVEVREHHLNRAKEHLAHWKARLPGGDGLKERSRRAECYGIHGATYKRIALLRTQLKEPDEKVKHEFAQSLDFYRRAMDEWAPDGEKHHWVTTQVLSLKAVLNEAPDPASYYIAMTLARRGLDRSSRSEQAWAHGTIAELELLSAYHLKDQPQAVKESVVEHCNAIVALMGDKSFHVQSTLRQFRRYVAQWQKQEWKDIAEAAVTALGQHER
jgi:hypothetical protein